MEARRYNGLSSRTRSIELAWREIFNGNRRMSWRSFGKCRRNWVRVHVHSCRMVVDPAEERRIAVGASPSMAMLLAGTPVRPRIVDD